ncbi:MAG: hypothetical protein FJZ01_12920 [Candidatus Sericytochromatia bacterium]|nr:hypothetical protein [Candidatus Tanganyikabacteria bacterium]
MIALPLLAATLVASAPPEVATWDALGPVAGLFVQAGARKYLAGDPSDFGYLGNPLPDLGFDRATILLDSRERWPLGYALRMAIPRAAAPHLVEGHLEVGFAGLALALGRLRAPLSAESLTEDWERAHLSPPRYLDAVADPTASFPFGRVVAEAARLSAGGDPISLTAWASGQDVAIRVDSRPVDWVQAGAFYLARDPFEPPIQGGARGFHDRWGGDVRLQLRRLRFSAEMLRGYEENAFGGAFAFGGQVGAALDIPGGHQFVVRYDAYAPEFRYAPGSIVAAALVAAARSETVTLGWNVDLPAPGTRLRLEYARSIWAGPRNADFLSGALTLRL